MDSLTDVLPVGLITPGAIILLCIWLVFTGRLVPRSSVSELLRVLREQRDDAQGESRDWKEAHRISEQAREVQAEQLTGQAGQIDELLQSSKTTLAVVEALRTTHQLTTGPTAGGGDT